ncbi:MAG: ribbon-helix-helix domain-containing protein [Hydrogenophaga sp.]|jgi:predicted DNA-binding ribbon-helix-helix protein|nr:ribbon-helix-helix domain-containing protein [Hydrogenophaga sp.]
MSEFFVKADPIQYEQRTRTVRIHNVLTSIRLENLAWDILADMAVEEGCTTNALIASFHDDILAQRGEVPNFASFLRVTCMRYLHRKAAQMGSPDGSVRSAANTEAGRALRPPKLVAMGRRG